MRRRLPNEEVDLHISGALDTYVKNWGPVSWRKRVENWTANSADSELSSIFSALANIEDDAFYMNVKLKAAGTLRRSSVEQFYTIWSAEESEHARILAKLSDLYGDSQLTAKHSTLKRDKRAIRALAGLRVGSIYERGMLASYLALGVAQEFVAITVYGALIKMVEEQNVRFILRDIIKQEGRHMRFYTTGCNALLVNDKVCQKFVRWVLTSYWRPPGIDLYGYELWRQLFAPFLEDPETCSKLIKLDEVLGRFDGMEGISIMKQFLQTSVRFTESVRC